MRNPLVEFSPDGAIVSVVRCETPDREARTEFYAGVLVVGFPDDFRTVFATLTADRPLFEQLAALPSGGAVVVLSGLDYDRFYLTPESRIERVL